MSSIFTKIINGDIPSYKIAENKYCYAFLDINPLVEGHTLVVPKVEVDYLFDLEDFYLEKMITFSKYVAKAIKKTVDCNRIGITVIGLEVPHAHIHLIPINGINDMNFALEKMKFSTKEFQSITNKIRANLND